MRGKWLQKEKGWIFPGSHVTKVVTALQALPQVTSVLDKTGSFDEAPDVKSLKRKEPDGSDVTSKDGDVRIDIGNNVFITVADCKGTRYVDVRKHYQDDTRNWRPTRKGVRLLAVEWTALYEAWGKIDALVKEAQGADILKLNLVQDIFVQAGKDFVDIREFYTDKADGVKKAGINGVRLSLHSWNKARLHKENINDYLHDGVEDDIVCTEALQNFKKAKEAEAASSSKIFEIDSDADIKVAVRSLLETKDLGTVTLKQIRRELEVQLGMKPGSLDEKKNTIKTVIQELIIAS